MTRQGLGSPARGQLIEEHLPLVRALARPYGRHGEPLDDLVQVGAIGLIKAADRFDAARGSDFAAFAAPTILGEIRHHLRDRCAPVRVPRRLQQEGVRVRPVELAADDDRAPTTEPLAATEDRLTLAGAFRELEPRERHLLHLRYFGDLSQAQIAAQVGLSQVHVSRLLRGALGKLRAALVPTG